VSRGLFPGLIKLISLEEYMSKKTIYIISGFVGLIILAGGAFFAMRMMSGGQANEGPGGGVMKMGFSSSGPGGKTGFSIEIEPSPDLPTREADANGIIKSIDNDNFIVQGGNKIMVAKSEDGSMNVQSDGPSTEVVITKDTKIYRDVTFDTHEPAPGNKKIQQLIEEFPANEIEKNDIASVWGSKRGDRLIAEVILISRPVLAKRSSEN
jgi:hypothetical protein